MFNPMLSASRFHSLRSGSGSEFQIPSGFIGFSGESVLQGGNPDRVRDPRQHGRAQVLDPVLRRRLRLGSGLDRRRRPRARTQRPRLR